jgi:predicted nucleotidyltransferase
MAGSTDRERVVRSFAAACARDDRIVAAFVGGSVARGTADAHSDLDLCVVTADDRFHDVYDDRGAIVGALGTPLFIEDWAGETPEVFVILDDGSELEMFFIREGELLGARVGPIVPLLDRRDLLVGVDLPIARPERDDLASAARDLLAWFWHDTGHLVTAAARGHRWWAYGQVEALRGHCVNVVRLEAGQPSEPEPYWKLDADLSTDVLEELRPTIVSVELSELANAGRALVAFFGVHGRAVAAMYDLDYPSQLEELIVTRLDAVITGEASQAIRERP